MSYPLEKLVSGEELEKSVSLNSCVVGEYWLVVASSPGGEILRLGGRSAASGGAGRGGCSAGLISGHPSPTRGANIDGIQIQDGILKSFETGTLHKGRFQNPDIV